MIESIASAGALIAVPVTGSVVLGNGPVRAGLAGRAPLVVAVGLSLWSVPLLGSLIIRAYRPELIGMAGWIVVAACLIARRRRPSEVAAGGLGPQRSLEHWAAALGRGIRTLRWPRIGASHAIRPPPLYAVVLGMGLAVACVLYAAAPSDPTAGGRDMAVYANHAVYMANHGRLDIPYPAGVAISQPMPDWWVGFSGVYSTEPTLTVQFAHLFPAWLAQVYAVGGFDTLLRLNALLAVLSGLAVFAVARLWMPRRVAVLAALFLAFNAGQVWVARNTLTETLTQLLVWTGFLLLVSPDQPRPRASAAWAGILLGTSAMVRIDSLVVLPLAIIGHTLVRALDRRRRVGLNIPTFYLAAVPTMALAAAYYVGFSSPYVTGHAWLVWLIVGAGGAAVMGLGLSFIPPTRIHASRLLRSPLFLACSSAAVILLAAFAYFVRPAIEPFALLPRDVSVPPRSYVEDAMRNLGAYVTPIALWLGVLGWLGATVVAIRRRAVRALPALIIIGGFSALYFWNQAITPDHFWAVRRFVPIILPGAIVFAGLAIGILLNRFPGGLRHAAFGMTVAALAAQTLWIGTPMFLVAERSGVYGALERFAAALPEGETAVGPFTQRAIHTSGTALFMTFDRDLVPIAVDREGGREEAIDRLRQASPQNPVLVLTELSDDPTGVEGRTIAEVHHTFARMAPTTTPVPRELLHDEVGLAARMVTGVNTVNVELGHHSGDWLVRQRGLYPLEDFDGHVARWTNGDARLRVPLFGDAVPRRLFLDLQSVGPVGATLGITYGGTVIWTGEIPPGPWQGTVDLPEESVGNDVIIRISTSTFVPAEIVVGSSDVRKLGVMVRSIRLLGS